MSCLTCGTDAVHNDRTSERFCSKVQINDDGCHLWIAYVKPDGYGLFWRGPGKGMGSAHIWAWERANGPVPDGLELDHQCRVRHCVNPNHLEPVTHAENMRRAAALRTHCKYGHEFTEENTRISPQGTRICRACETRRSNEKAATPEGRKYMTEYNTRRNGTPEQLAYMREYNANRRKERVR